MPWARRGMWSISCAPSVRSHFSERATTRRRAWPTARSTTTSCLETSASPAIVSSQATVGSCCIQLYYSMLGGDIIFLPCLSILVHSSSVTLCFHLLSNKPALVANNSFTLLLGIHFIATKQPFLFLEIF